MLRWQPTKIAAAPDLYRSPRRPARHGVDYVLIGGMTARVFGASRQTADLDILARDIDDNIDRPAATSQASPGTSSPDGDGDTALGGAAVHGCEALVVEQTIERLPWGIEPGPALQERVADVSEGSDGLGDRVPGGAVEEDEQRGRVVLDVLDVDAVVAEHERAGKL